MKRKGDKLYVMSEYFPDTKFKDEEEKLNQICLIMQQMQI